MSIPFKTLLSCLRMFCGVCTVCQSYLSLPAGWPQTPSGFSPLSYTPYMSLNSTLTFPQHIQSCLCDVGGYTFDNLLLVSTPSLPPPPPCCERHRLCLGYRLINPECSLNAGDTGFKGSPEVTLSPFAHPSQFRSCLHTQCLKSVELFYVSELLTYGIICIKINVLTAFIQD